MENSQQKTANRGSGKEPSTSKKSLGTDGRSPSAAPAQTTKKADTAKFKPEFQHTNPEDHLGRYPWVGNHGSTK
ncbi:hypothetical protein N7456_006405 [Penicillium angulare]|uniref:Uncharacterized protein n=1 Tax=Penicillium angulare TaxID=116970 RepID=A0A9W9FHR0_9EURO|nr:hypothetical protein N7456_006405 [Penicillium angulare]